jgi:hypothetical protein
MSEAKLALVLHLVGGGEPVIIAVGTQTAQELTPRLEQWLKGGVTQTITADNGARITINYAHVATAHVQPWDVTARLYGFQKR